MAKRRGHKSKSPSKNTRRKEERAESASQLHSQLSAKGTNHDTKSNLGSGAKGGILSNPDNAKETASDLKLVDKAIRERWDVKNKQTLQHRLVDVARKTSVPVLTKAGIFDSEEAADANAISAIKTLVQMNAQDQDDDHSNAKLNKPLGPSTVVNVNVDPNRSRLLELAHKLGARELVVDGRAIPTSGATE